jgi:plastocyanin
VRDYFSQIEKRLTEHSKFILVLLAFLFAACANPDARKILERQPQVHEVEIKGFQFKPRTLTIFSGDSVRWVNRDIVPHRVADSRRKKWESHDMKQAGSFSQSIRVSTAYVCLLHPGMKADIVIKEG